MKTGTRSTGCRRSAAWTLCFGVIRSDSLPALISRLLPDNIFLSPVEAGVVEMGRAREYPWFHERRELMKGCARKSSRTALVTAGLFLLAALPAFCDRVWLTFAIDYGS